MVLIYQPAVGDGLRGLILQVLYLTTLDQRTREHGTQGTETRRPIAVFHLAFMTVMQLVSMF